MNHENRISPHSIKGLKEKRNDLLDKVGEILEVAQTEKRAFTSEELEKVNGYKAEVEQLTTSITAYQDARDLVDERRPVIGGRKQAEKVIYKPNEKIATAETRTREDNVTLEGLMKALVTGKHINQEVRNYMSANLNTVDSSVLVPQKLSANILDMIRNESAFLKSLPVVPMTSNNLTVARLVEDLVFTIIPEGEAIPYSNATFEGVKMEGQILASIVGITQTLLDASNVDTAIMTALTKGIASSLDKQLLYGTATVADGKRVGIEGATKKANIKKIEVEKHDYVSLLKGIQAVKQGNYNPTHVIMSTDTALELAMTKDQQGQFINPPKALEGMTILESNNMEAGDIVVYDPTQLVVGMGKKITLEAGHVADDFQKIKKSLRAYCQADLGVLRADAFALVTVKAPTKSK